MKQNYKTLQIEIPDGYEIDAKNSTFENIVFKKKDSKPRSWEEYCELQKINKATGCYINDTSNCLSIFWLNCNTIEDYTWRNVLPSKEYAEAFLALMQLVSLRKAWIGDWEFNFNDGAVKWIIQQAHGKFIVTTTISFHSPLSFPTEEMTEDFLECFKDLLEQAKILL